MILSWNTDMDAITATSLAETFSSPLRDVLPVIDSLHRTTLLSNSRNFPLTQLRALLAVSLPVLHAT